MSGLWRRPYHPAWSQPRPRFIFSRGPLAWWTFDEASGNPLDSTNNHYDGTLVGTPAYEAGHLGNALRLSGAGGGSAEYVSFGVHAEFLAVSAPRTYAGWVKFGTLTGQHAILSNIEASGDFQGFLIEQNNGTIRVYCDSSTPQLTVSNVILNTTDWVHITVVLDAGVIRVYRNGSRIGSDGAYTSVSVASPTPKPLTLGHQTDITNRDLNGAVDDWRIYDYALNDAQVAALAGLAPGDTAGTIAGAATVIGVGAAVQEAAAGSAAGVATVSGAGASVQAGVGTSQGSALVVGAVASIGSSSGIATVTGIGASTQAASGSAAGMATVAGVGASIQASVGTSQGSALVVGAAAGSAASVGSSSGLATVTGVGARSAAGVGSAAGMASVTGVGARTTSGVGTAQGSASVSGATTAAGVSQGAGTAAGVASVAGVGSRIAAAQGTAVGIAIVTGASVTGAIGDPDLAHPIHASLVMFVGSHPTGAAELAHERVANGLVTTFGTATFAANHPDKPWKCLQTNGGTSGAWTPLTTQFQQITGNFTLWFDLIPTGFVSSSHIINVPWDASANWSAPFIAIDYLRTTTTTRAKFQFTPASALTTYTGTNDGSFPTTSTRKRFWCRRSGTTLTLGIGATTLETFTGISSASPNWASVTSGKIVFGARKPENTTAEAFAATYLRAMAWNRALSNAELAQLDADPLLGLILTTATATAATGTAQGQANVFGATPITTAPSFTSSGHYGGASFGETGFGEARFVVPGTAAVGDGTAQGIAAVSGIGARIAAAAGTCIVPAALVAGATTTIKGTAGTATGVASVTGVGARQSETTAATAGSATIAGVGASTQAAAGTSTGAATAQGNTATTGTAAASAAGVATVLGIGPTLRTQAEIRGVVIGAGMRNWSVFSSTPDLQTLVEREYNGLTPGTAFNWNVIEPSQGVFDFTEADLFVAWADARDLPLRLHTLVSHNNLPSWVPGALVPGSGNWQSIINTHIAGVLGHYPNRPWDIEVVSDAFNPGDGLVGGFRNTLWYQNAAASANGPDYIAHAFQQARIAEPFAELFLSDFGVERAGEDLKRADILAALAGWLDQNVPITGFSIQGHLDPTVQIDVPAFRAFLRGLADLGLGIAISEFDFRGIAALDLSDPAAFAALSAQAKLFLEIALDEGAQSAQSITTWGVSPEDWEATGTEQIPAVPFGTSPGFATNPIFDAIELALEGVSGRIAGVATVIGTSSYGVTGSAQGAATVISIGGQIQDTAGTAEGATAVEGEAAVFASADGTATGTATVAGQDEREAAALATAAGSATVAGVGARTTAVAGNAIGIAAVNGTGARVAAVAGTAAGVATVFGISEQGSTRGEAIGTSQVIGQGARTAASSGAAQGVGAVAGVAAAGQAAAGTAAGVATVAGAGARTAASAGSATSVAAVAGITELGSAIGTSAGVATVVGRGAWITATTGAASGVASVVGVGAKTIGTAGTASGTANVVGEGARIAAAVGTAQGTATVSAITEQGSTTGQATGTSLAIGIGARISGAIATASGSAQAQANSAWITATVGTAHGSATVTAASIPEPFVPLPGVIWSVDQAMPAVTWGKGEPGPVKWPRAA